MLSFLKAFPKSHGEGNEFSSSTNRDEIKLNIVNGYLSFWWIRKQLIQHTDENIV